MRKILFLIFIVLITSSVYAVNPFLIPSLDEKIGQMIMVGFHGTDIEEDDIYEIKNNIENGEIGGIVLLARNIENKDQVKILIQQFRSIKTLYPLIIAIDEEGGNVERLNDKNGFKHFPSAKEIGNKYSPKEAYSIYLELANMLKEIGINMNFIPVVDLNINPDSPAIGRLERSYSSDPEIVISYAKQAINAHYKNGILTSLKHFPGHGSATKDSHLGVVDVTNTWDESEMIPYETLIDKGFADAVLSSHIYNANVDPKYPASLSYNHIQKDLRGKLGYDGVVITDDLQMGAIRNNYYLKEVVINSINAGNDILLNANYFIIDKNLPLKIRKIIKQAIKNGDISKNRINESFIRIMTLKNQMN